MNVPQRFDRVEGNLCMQRWRIQFIPPSRLPIDIGPNIGLDKDVGCIVLNVETRSRHGTIGGWP